MLVLGSGRQRTEAEATSWPASTMARAIGVSGKKVPNPDCR
jgi:hypothetical protein